MLAERSYRANRQAGSEYASEPTIGWRGQLTYVAAGVTTVFWKLEQSAWWAETEAAPRRVPVTARAQLSAAQAMVVATRERMTATFIVMVVVVGGGGDL